MIEKTNATGRIIAVKSKHVVIKILGRTDGGDDKSNDDDFVIEFAIPKEHRQMYLDAVGTVVPVTFEKSIDETKNRLLLDISFSISDDKV